MDECGCNVLNRTAVFDILLYSRGSGVPRLAAVCWLSESTDSLTKK